MSHGSGLGIALASDVLDGMIFIDTTLSDASLPFKTPLHQHCMSSWYEMGSEQSNTM